MYTLYFKDCVDWKTVKSGQWIEVENKYIICKGYTYSE